MRVITWRGRLNPVQTHPGEISNSTDSRLLLAVVTRVPGSRVWELEALRLRRRACPTAGRRPTYRAHHEPWASGSFSGSVSQKQPPHVPRALPRAPLEPGGSPYKKMSSQLMRPSTDPGSPGRSRSGANGWSAIALIYFDDRSPSEGTRWLSGVTSDRVPTSRSTFRSRTDKGAEPRRPSPEARGVPSIGLRS